MSYQETKARLEQGERKLYRRLILLAGLTVLCVVIVGVANLRVTLKEIDRAKSFSELNTRLNKVQICILSVPAVSRTINDIERCQERYMVKP